MLCVFIMLGHFLGLYKYAESFQPNFVFLDFLYQSSASFLLDESYWLYLFFLISGYLVAQSHIKSGRDAIYKSINRFFRLAFPIFFSCLIIYLLYLLVGFHNAETTSVFRCDWYQGYYQYTCTVMDALCSPIDVLFFNKYVLNSPYWVLHEMFMAAIAIYFLKWGYYLLSKKHETFGFSVLMIVMIIISFISDIIACCLAGMMVAICEKTDRLFEKRYFLFWIIVVAMLMYISSEIYISLLFFTCLIVLTPNIKFLNSMLSSKLFKFLGEISWGVYSFHWPLMCSLGPILIINLEPYFGLTKSYWVFIIIISLITVLLSYVYYLTFERLSVYLTGKASKYIRKYLNFTI